MDYREIENRLARNREMIREREFERYIKHLLNAEKPVRRTGWKRLLQGVLSLRLHTRDKQPCLSLLRQARLDEP